MGDLMSILSDRDIIRKLGKGIYFHPLKPGSIKACDLCLTASEYAYSIGMKHRLPIDTETNKDNPQEEQKFFFIPPKDTALIWTDESVWLSNQFRGPLYSVVYQVSNGLAHIGTRVNPYWSGVLCIAIHNFSEESIRINVRDVKHPIAYLAIERLSSKTISEAKSDNPARLDVLGGRLNRNEIDDYFNQRENSWMRGDTERLKKMMIESEEYKKIKVGLQDTLLNLLGSDEQVRWTAVSGIAAIIAVMISIFALFKPESSSNSSWNNLIQQLQTQVNLKINPNTNNSLF
jgi:deoxycytidine triphosphate deaminase